MFKHKMWSCGGKAVSLALAALLAVFATGCGNKGEDTADQAAASPVPTASVAAPAGAEGVQLTPANGAAAPAAAPAPAGAAAPTQ